MIQLNAEVKNKEFKIGIDAKTEQHDFVRVQKYRKSNY